MDIAITSCRVHQCSKCPGNTEYLCVSCPCDMCAQCNETHVKDIKTMDHKVLSYHNEFNYIPTQEICVKHPRNVKRLYCEHCKIPVCYHCAEHRKHRTLDIITAYQKKKQQHIETIHTIKGKALLNRPVLLPDIKAEIKTCRTEFSRYQSEMLIKAQKLRNRIDYVQNDFMNNVFCHFDFKHRCLKQKREMEIHIAGLERYVHQYERTAISPLQFLLSIKAARLPEIHLTLHTSQLSMTESFNKEGVIKSLSGIQIKGRGNRRVGNKCLLKLMSAPEFHQSLNVKGVCSCLHISCVTSDRVWVSDRNILILTSTTGETLHQLKDLYNDLYGLHTLNSENELIYLKQNYTINKLSEDMKSASTFLETTDFTWIPRCVHWSLFTGDLLVGMFREDTKISWTGNVSRFNQSGQLTQTIPCDNTSRPKLFNLPNYITENSNGDVVVSDYESGAVVVTERGGRHRFSYTGHPSGSILLPLGICTDALSHILVCDDRTSSVQMLDRDGQFLSHLLTKSLKMGKPWSLSFDFSTHRLWVGYEDNNKLDVYRYITREDALTDSNHDMKSLSGFPNTGTEKIQQENACLLKLISPPEILHSLTVTGVRYCYHISCVTSDRVWVNDKNNLIFTNTKGDALHHVYDSCSVYNGPHTVNSESELIYIDKHFNIKKLSKDMKTTTTFIKIADDTWRSRCVYVSPSTGDLLVGMCYIHAETGKVTRYNQTGQLIQTIQNDNTGRELYKQPIYITENNNGDVVVCDSQLFMYGAVVVTERGGRHRFSYTGHPSGSGLQPGGICTDTFSHILVCDDKTNTIQMLDRDGQFLSHLLNRSKEMGEPSSLSYDVNTQRLWVGSWYDNKMCVYRYITRQGTYTEIEPAHRPDGDVLSSLRPA